MALKRIGFIGLGVMGSGMCRNLLKAGFELTVFNRSTPKITPLVEAGAQAADSAAELGSKVDVILTCVTDDLALEEIYAGPDGVLRGTPQAKLAIDFSTIPPDSAIHMGQVLQERGIRFLDAPVSGGDIGAQKGTLTVMVGGDKDGFAQASSILTCLGNNVIHTGELGSGQQTKAVNQVVVALTTAAMTEGLFLAERAGLDLEKTLQVISGGAANSWVVENLAPRVLRNEFGPGFYAKDMLKDLRIALAQARSTSAALPMCQLSEELFQALAGLDDASLATHALIEVYRMLPAEMLLSEEEEAE